MSTDFITLKKFRASDLFDGRLEKFGVREHIKADETTEHNRCLTDGRNYVWVGITEDGLVSGFITYGWNAPGTIFNAVEATFDTKIFSEHEPQYWGFETEEEWDADEEKKGKESAERFHLEILKYLQGEPNDIQPGTDGMRVAEIAKKLVEKDPTLLLPVNKDKFRNEIQSAYENEYQSTERQMPNRDNPLMDTLESMLTFQRNWRGTGDVMPKIVNEEYLRTAQPHLICRMDLQTNGQIKPTPRIDEVERGWDEVVDEGYDPDNSPLGCPVYWRAVIRGEEQLYLSTFVASRDFIIKAWGSRGLDYCDPITGTAVARIEANLRSSGWHEHRARLPESKLQYIERIVNAREKLAK